MGLFLVIFRFIDQFLVILSLIGRWGLSRVSR